MVNSRLAQSSSVLILEEGVLFLTDVWVVKHNSRHATRPARFASEFRERNMAQRKKSGSRRYGKAAGKTVASAMRRRKRGTLKSGKGGKGGTVKSRKQAIAIGLSEARKKGAKVPRKAA